MQSEQKVDAAHSAMKEVHRFLTLVQSGNLTQIQHFIDDYIKKHDDPSSPITAEDVVSCIKDGNGRTALHFSAIAGHTELINWFVQEFSLKFIDFPDDKGLTALSVALITGNVKVAEVLIAAGADVNKADIDGITCLHRAAGHGDLDSVKLLCSNQADIHKQSSAGSAIHWAAGEGHDNVVKELISLGANCDAPNKQGLTPIIMAAAGGHGSTVALLADSNVIVDSVFDGGYTVLHICSDLGMDIGVDAILKSESGRKCAKLANEAGFRPLDLAAMARHTSTVKILLPFTFEKDHVLPSVDDIMSVAAKRSAELQQSIEEKSSKDTLQAHHQHNDCCKVSEIIVSEQDRIDAEEAKKDGNLAFLSNPPRLSEAIQFYSRSIELNPNNHVYWSNRSAVWSSLNEHQNALKDAEQCRKLNPSWAKACYRMAIARENLGMFEEAAISAWEGVQIDNTNEELKKILQRCVEKGRGEHLAKLQQNK